MTFDLKAQGAIEYLLIIGAAILVVAIVIVAITSVVSVGKPNGMPEEIRQTNTLRCNADITSILTTGGEACHLGPYGNVTNYENCDCCNPNLVDKTKVIGLINGQTAQICNPLPT